MPETPNHGYNVPNEGEQDWHEPLNANFEQYDTDIEIRDKITNRGDYEPKAGAKFFATDEGLVMLGTGEEWKPVRTTGSNPRIDSVTLESRNPSISLVPTGSEDSSSIRIGSAGLIINGPSPSIASTDTITLTGGDDANPPIRITGRNNWNLDESDGDVRIGGLDHRLAIGVSLGGSGAGTARLRAKGGTEQLKLGAGQNDTLTVQASSVSVDGDFDVSGNKNFTQSVDTDDGEKEVVYTASEAPTPRTESSGVAQLEDGRAEVDLPEHFAWVTSDEEPLVVQTTPYGGERGLKVVERSTGRVVVEDLDGEGDYEFAYTVKGTRAGHADKAVVREPSPQQADGTSGTPADD
jgi:hypothetical protein